MNFIKVFASSGPTVYVAPEKVFTLYGWPISNSMIYGWAVILILFFLFIWAGRHVKIHPGKGFIGLIEEGVNFITNLVENSFNNPEVGRKYIPYFVTLFFFILFNNWTELLPVINDAFNYHKVPLLRPFTADLNATFAMGLITMGLVYYASVRESGGLKNYFQHFFVGSPKNPLFLIIGLLEMFTDLTRVISLSLRLYLNVTIGMIVIDVFAYLGHIIAPISALPFYLIEIFICMLQAYIFTILSVMYLAVAVNHSAEHSSPKDEDEYLTEDVVPERIRVESGSVGTAGGA